MVVITSIVFTCFPCSSRACKAEKGVAEISIRKEGPRSISSVNRCSITCVPPTVLYMASASSTMTPNLVCGFSFRSSRIALIAFPIWPPVSAITSKPASIVSRHPPKNLFNLIFRSSRSAIPFVMTMRKQDTCLWTAAQTALIVLLPDWVLPETRYMVSSFSPVGCIIALKHVAATSWGSNFPRHCWMRWFDMYLVVIVAAYSTVASGTTAIPPSPRPSWIRARNVL